MGKSIPGKAVQGKAVPVPAVTKSGTTAATASSTNPPRGSTVTTNPHLKRSLPTSSSSRTTTTKSGGKPPMHSGATLQIKKRPYRRTKRPKNYCDKSTVTTVTTPTRQEGNDAGHEGGSTYPEGTNVYDAVLGECEDLLRASTEAQRLGRLKMASAYQLLLHTRLVGLGKRFDRSAMMVDQQKAKQQQQQLRAAAHQQNEQQKQEFRKQLDLGASNTAAGVDKAGDASKDGASLETANAPKDAGCREAANTPLGEARETSSTSPVPPALQQLRSILPGNLEMDASMMEHLARAAVELHHQRTGRKKSADGLLASPLNGTLSTATTATINNAVSSPLSETNNNTSAAEEASTQRSGSTNATVTVGDATATTTKPASSTTKKSSVAWTPSETAIVIKALKEGKDNYTIASTLLPNKTVAQVHAFVKNQQQLHKVNKLTQRQQTQLQQQQQQADKLAKTGSTPALSGTSAAVDSTKPPATVVSSSTAAAESAASASTATTTGKSPAVATAVPALPKRGGRGRKPPTTAMNTVPNVSMDVRTLLRKANEIKQGDDVADAATSAAESSTTPPDKEEQVWI